MDCYQLQNTRIISASAGRIINVRKKPYVFLPRPWKSYLIQNISHKFAANCGLKRIFSFLSFPSLFMLILPLQVTTFLLAAAAASLLFYPLSLSLYKSGWNADIIFKLLQSLNKGPSTQHRPCIGSKNLLEPGTHPTSNYVRTYVLVHLLYTDTESGQKRTCGWSFSGKRCAK